ncbi:secreted hydrolase [Cystobacter fuscus DSM 2262]|uniref:chitinase n=1 Tax=Cystobacter fuscus (strain ATCC 25194 / DSM 2262 / NBRC 100088 / M29) TaxID=1242864 RepID=S9P0V2_CYSF2|nr:ricin-type beta-trefoil lectin domain protein [Cystobacter fuscus]EPX55907.1 secreted hydrolase [Cystobacter fuscus DSM 2262]
MSTQRTRPLGRRLAAASVATTAVALLAAAPSASAAPNPTGPVKGLAGKCIDVASGNSANGTPIQLYDCNSSAAQQINLNADGTLRVLGKCLDVTQSGTANGTTIQLWDCNGTGAQQWIHTPGQDFVNPQSNKCLDVANNNSANGTRLHIWDCVGVSSQKWTPPAHPRTYRRTVVYYQTQYNGGTYVSPLGLTNNNTRVTDVIVAAIHLNSPTQVHLNDHPPSDARFQQMWRDLAAMQAKGVRVLGMVGGAAQGSFQRLDTDFNTYYPILKNIITTYKLDGVDLDVEEYMSLAGIERVIRALRADFGPNFVITLAPVATALYGGGNLSGFNYEQLYRDVGSQISWFNGQFYNGWGYMGTPANYQSIINRGLIPAQKVVAGMLSNPGNGGSGYIDIPTAKSTVSGLVGTHQSFGGAASWEYFNSLPGNTGAPWQWAAELSSAMGR